MTSLVNSTKPLVGVKTHLSQTFPKNCKETGNLFYEARITLTPNQTKISCKRTLKANITDEHVHKNP